MGHKAAKIAVSVPDDLFREIERKRKKERRTRSALVQDALRLWLRQQTEAALAREWEAGYRRMPDSAAEVEAATATAPFAFAEDDW